jgi:hypothetical protein
LTTDYLIPILVNAVKEMMTDIEKLQEEITVLKAKVNS